MALISLEQATDGLLRTGGLQSLATAVRGLLNTDGVVAAVLAKFEGLRQNVGRMMR